MPKAQAKNALPDFNFLGYWQDLSKNGVDFSGFANIARKNFEAVSAANQIVTEKAQEFARRGADNLQKSVSEAVEVARETLSNTGSPETNLERAAEFAREAFESTVDNTKKNIETVSKTTVEVFAILNKRLLDSINEISEAASGN